MRDQLFWKNVDILGPSDCWNWKLSTNECGYGRMLRRRDGRAWRFAHRYALHLSSNNVPAGSVVCHRCDNPRCCNPNHLFVGSHADNVADCVRKKRNQRGERHYSTPLTNDDVYAIRAAQSAAGLAAQYGISTQAIWCIRTRKTWRHI